MIIGIDAEKAGAIVRTGIENYVYELILNLKKLDHGHVYFLYTNKPLPEELTDSVNFVEKLIPIKRGWNRLILPLAVYKYRPDIYLQPTDKIPWSAPRKSVAVVHDLAWKRFPNAYSARDRLLQNQALSNASKKALAIICPSKSTQKDLVSNYPAVKGKTKVIPLGFDKQVFRPIFHPRNILHLKEKYLLYTGRLEGRKNISRLIRAFVILKNEKSIPHKLVLAGFPGQNYDQIQMEIMKAGKFEKDILLPGHIDHKRLPDLISLADIFAFPTLYEGFGLPILEAFACGTPVLSSNCSSIPELAGEAALLCNPEDENDIAAKLYRLISDDKLKSALAKKGIARAKSFSWQNTAKETLSILEKI